MPYFRFEDIENRRLTAHLSSGTAPIIEGQYLYFCLNQKKAGTGSELHYHPNELLIFVLRGKVNAVVGRAQRIVDAGTFIIIPPNARHSMRATEDGPCAYLYIKDRTWTVVGVAVDEALPERPLTMDESEEIVRTGVNPNEIVPQKGVSQAIIDGIPNCYYPLTADLNGDVRYGSNVQWIEGERAAFGFFEVPVGFNTSLNASEHEQFFYICHGEVDALIDNEAKRLKVGDIAQVPRGGSYSLSTSDTGAARFVAVKSTDYLEKRLDARSPS